MDHVEAVSLFSAYHDGELDAEQARAVAEHLGTCAACRDDYETFKRALGALRSLKAGAPGDFRGSIERQIWRRSRGRFFGRPTWASRVPWEGLSLVTLLLLALLYLLLAVAQPGRLVDGGAGGAGPPASSAGR